MIKHALIVLIILSCLSLPAQTPYFASPNQQLLALNPSFAGSNARFRAQAVGGSIDFTKYSYLKSGYYAGVDVLVKKHSGIGLSFFETNYGTAYKTVQAGLSYAYHFTVRDRLKIVPSLQASFFQVASGSSNLPTSGGFVPQTTADNGRLVKQNLDLSAGLLVFGKKFFGGASILGFNQPDEGVFGVDKRPLTQVYQAGYRFPVNPASSVDPYLILKSQKYRENFLQYGANVVLGPVFSLHLANRIYETSSVKALVTGFSLNFSGFRIGYNLQSNFQPSQSTNFFNEAYLSVNFGQPKKDADGNTVSDPSLKLFY